MKKYILAIDGMRCGMCEIHVEEALARFIKAKKINANHLKGSVTIITENEYSLVDFKKALDPTGYYVINFEVGEAKKTLFGYK